MGLRARAGGVLLAVLWIASAAPGRAEAAGPIQVWTADFTDSAALEEWRYWPSDVGQITKDLVPRQASDPSRHRVLELRGSSTPELVSSVGIFHPLPPGFPSDPHNPLIVEWEWKIADTEISNLVHVSVLPWPVPPPDVVELPVYGQVFSHTLSTVGWSVLFDPPNTWVAHRVNLGPFRDTLPWPLPPGRELGVAITFLNPVRQVVHLSRLRVEEWPAGSVASDPAFRPRDMPPAHEPFVEAPLGALRGAVGGGMEDLDGDGRPELLVLQWRGYAHLYHNEGGEFGRDISREAGLELFGLGTGVLFLDLDGDRDRDLVVTSEFGRPRIYEGRAGPRFDPRAMLEGHYSFWYGAAADDLDGDRDPDLLFVSPWEETFLFLENEGSWRLRPEPMIESFTPPDELCANFGGAFADVDEDGASDLVLGHQHFFWNRDGSFVLDDSVWPVPAEGKTEGMVFDDFTGDGVLDLLLLRDASETDQAPSRLLVGDGRAGFVDRTADSDLPWFDSAEVALAEDFDNDGARDLYVCQRSRANYLLLNNGAGVFHDATEGSGFEDLGGCDAAIAGDIDGDGGMDVVVLSYGEQPRVHENRLNLGNWLGVVVQGQAPATDAIGARVRIVDGATGQVIATHWVRRGRGFGSTGPQELRLGVGVRRKVDLEVSFRGGARRWLQGLTAGRTVLVREPASSVVGQGRRRLAEVRYPWAATWRRRLAGSRAPVVLVSFIALVTGLATARRGVSRTIAGAMLASGLGVIVFLEAGQAGEPTHSAAFPWVLGAIVGAAAPVGFRAGRRLLRRPSGPRAQVGHEELVRFTHDFRHAGIETESLLSIEARVQNLWFEGRLHRPFLEELRERAARFEGTGVIRLRELLDRADTVFDELRPARDVRRLVDQLVGVLAELRRIGDDETALGGWRGRALPLLRDTRRLVAGLLERIDRLCSCDVAEVIRDVSRMQADALGRAGVRLQLRGVETPATALITRGELSTILENLFTNAIAALADSPERRIEVTLRPDGRKTTIEFRDTGRGVPGAERERLFEYGFSTRPDGQGYGLARTREILGHFGGNIVADAAQGRGTAFRVALRSVPPAADPRG